MNKRGSGAGEMIEMIPALVIICIIAFTVFGISSSYYAYEVSVRDVEARLLGMTVIDCLMGNAVLNLDEIDEEDYEKILSYCGLEDKEERFYVGVEVLDSLDKRIELLSEGDSGLLWMRGLFDDVVMTGNAMLGVSEGVEKIIEYRPGYFEDEYLVYVIEDGNKKRGSVKLEVLVSYEDE